MRTNITVDNDTIRRLHEIADALAAPFSAKSFTASFAKTHRFSPARLPHAIQSAIGLPPTVAISVSTPYSANVFAMISSPALVEPSGLKLPLSISTFIVFSPCLNCRLATQNVDLNSMTYIMSLGAYFMSGAETMIRHPILKKLA